LAEAERVIFLEKRFPRLRGRYRVTSPRTSDYNCFAYAADAREQQTNWSPSVSGLGREFWPQGVRRALTLAAFIDAYASVGYSVCEDGGLDPALEKIALYVVSGEPRHAARQLPSGLWTSKIGFYEDIEHELGALEGDDYGLVEQILARPRVTPTPCLA
jgi:hypothetical protein